MKTALLTLFVVYLLLLAHVRPSISRPADRNTYEGSILNLSRVLSEGSVQDLLYFLRERFHRNFDGSPRVLVSLSRAPARDRSLPDHQISAKELSQVLSILRSVSPESSRSGEEALRSALEEFSERLKREDPPISIDLTFHILRQMIEIAKTQSQKQQAEQNRIIFDSVGK